MSHHIHKLFAAIALIFTVPAAAQACLGDVVADGRVDGGDLGVLLANWGTVVLTSPVSRACDVDSNGQVNGADLGLLLSTWGYCPATISNVSPNQGCVLAGTVISITGTWLGQTSAITIGGVPCTSVTPVSSTVVTAITPTGSIGPASIVVTTPAGTTSASQTFTYMPTSISSITPNEGSITGGTEITIIGEYLATTTTVSVGGVLATNVTVLDSNTVTAVSPPGSLGSADVVITGGKGTITAQGGFRYVSMVPSWATMIEGLPDSAVVTDASLRAAIERTGLAWRVRDTATQIELLLVPPGTYIMGCSPSIQHGCYPDESPTHSVTLTHAFYLGRYEVTQSQWQARMGYNPSWFNGLPDAYLCPVEQVSWNMVQVYCGASGMRLPTEAEWEYACRAGTTTAFSNGSDDEGTASTVAWYGILNPPGRTFVVGGKAPNALGLHDMLGNVWEWVIDSYTEYSGVAQTDPQGSGSLTQCVLRGGGWSGSASAVRCSYRIRYPVGERSFEMGFRVARNP